MNTDPLDGNGRMEAIVTRTGIILALAAVLLPGCDLEAKLEAAIVEEGASALVTIENTTQANIAFGGCNPALYEERLPGRWVPDPLLRLACGGDLTLEDGRLPAFAYAVAAPGENLTLEIPTSWVSALPAIIRGRFSVKTWCTPPNEGGFECEDSLQLITDPIVIVEVGTVDTVDRR
jgi:hypothetical protein